MTTPAKSPAEKPYRVQVRVLVFATAYVKAEDANHARVKADLGNWQALSIEEDTARCETIVKVEDDI